MMSASPESEVFKKIYKHYARLVASELDENETVTIYSDFLYIFEYGVRWFADYCVRTLSDDKQYNGIRPIAKMVQQMTGALKIPTRLIIQWKTLSTEKPIDTHKEDLSKNWKEGIPHAVAYFYYFLHRLQVHGVVTTKRTERTNDVPTSVPTSVPTEKYKREHRFLAILPSTRPPPRNVPLIKERRKKSHREIEDVVTSNNVFKYPEQIAYLMKMSGSWQGLLADSFKVLREHVVQDENPSPEDIYSFIALGAILNLVQRDAPPTITRLRKENLGDFASRVLYHDVYKSKQQGPTKEFYDTMQSLIDLHDPVRLNRVLIDRYIMV